jgi:hypothetical protein
VLHGVVTDDEYFSVCTRNSNTCVDQPTMICECHGLRLPGLVLEIVQSFDVHLLLYSSFESPKLEVQGTFTRQPIWYIFIWLITGTDHSILILYRLNVPRFTQNRLSIPENDRIKTNIDACSVCTNKND